jgi:hypothetical protein
VFARLLAIAAQNGVIVELGKRTVAVILSLRNAVCRPELVAMVVLVTESVQIRIYAVHNGDTAEQAVITAAPVLQKQLQLKPSPRNRKRESGPLIFQTMQTAAAPALATS